MIVSQAGHVQVSRRLRAPKPSLPCLAESEGPAKPASISDKVSVSGPVSEAPKPVTTKAPDPSPSPPAKKPSESAVDSPPQGVFSGIGGALLMETQQGMKKGGAEPLIPRAGSLLAAVADAAAKVDSSEASQPALPEGIREYSYREPKRSLPKTSGFDAAAFTEQLNKKTRDNLRLLGPEHVQRFQWLDESSAVENVIAEALECAQRRGVIGAGAQNESRLKEAVGFQIMKQLRAGGVKLDKRVRDDYAPFQVFRTEDEDGKASETDLSLRGGSKYLMISQRVMELYPPSTSNGVQKVSIYNASSDDLPVVLESLQDMDQHAPRLLTKLENIHMFRTLGGSVSKEISKEGDSTRTKPGSVESSSSTNGVIYTANSEAMKFDTSNAILIKKAPMNTGPGRLSKLHPEGIPEGAKRATKVKATIYHEAAHLLDREKGTNGKFWSEQKGSPFLQEGKLKREDFVSDYAMTDATEDFAETAKFVVELAARDNPNILEGRPLTPSLRKKLVVTAVVIGADLSLLDKIEGWQTTTST